MSGHAANREQRCRLALLGAAFVALAGCELGPEPTPPTPVLPDAWTGSAEGTTPEAPDTEAWWRTFDDETLDELIILAGERNLDLRIAASRVREARAAYGIAAADLFPTASLGGDVYRFEGSRP